MSTPGIGTYASCTRGDWTVTSADDGSVVLVKPIAGDEPYLSGHYPGNPVYPGVFQLDLCCDLIRATLGTDAILAEIESIRFVAPVVPGAEITVRAVDKPSRGVATDETERRVQFIGRDHANSKLFSVLAKVRVS